MGPQEMTLMKGSWCWNDKIKYNVYIWVRIYRIVLSHDNKSSAKRLFFQWEVADKAIPADVTCR